jgi:hypothetical protein
MANGQWEIERKRNGKDIDLFGGWENNSAKLILFWNWNGIITKYCKMKAPERT